MDEATKRKLKHVRVSDDGVDLGRFPDFLIIGPQRTGTTWLHANLRFHPQIFMAEPKELFFFSRLKTPEHPKFQSDDLVWYLQFFRDPLWRALAKNAICLWKYRELYRPRIRGEATASYAAIDRDVVEDIAALNPEIKAILSIRNPIDRAWSHAKKDLVRNRKRQFEDVTEAEFLTFFDDPYQRQCARYVECFDNWSGVLKPGNLFVALFDDIATRPEDLLLDVMTFLGVRSDKKYLGNQARESVNPTGASEIPQRYRAYLEELLAPDVENLRTRWGLSWEDGRLVRRERPPAVSRGRSVRGP